MARDARVNLNNLVPHLHDLDVISVSLDPVGDVQIRHRCSVCSLYYTTLAVDPRYAPAEFFDTIETAHKRHQCELNLGPAGRP